MKRRVLSVVLATVMTVSFAACTKAEGNPGGTGNSGEGSGAEVQSLLMESLQRQDLSL